MHAFVAFYQRHDKEYAYRSPPLHKAHPISGSSYLAQALWAEPWHRGERLPEKKTARESLRAQAVHSYSCTWRDGRKLSSLFLSLA
jgi:hypothetical protein